MPGTRVQGPEMKLERWVGGLALWEPSQAHCAALVAVLLKGLLNSLYFKIFIVWSLQCPVVIHVVIRVVILCIFKGMCVVEQTAFHRC